MRYVINLKMIMSITVTRNHISRVTLAAYQIENAGERRPSHIDILSCESIYRYQLKPGGSVTRACIKAITPARLRTSDADIMRSHRRRLYPPARLIKLIPVARYRQQNHDGEITLGSHAKSLISAMTPRHTGNALTRHSHDASHHRAR